jgi:5-methylcytosine-specific restriction endonuclease McrA
MILPVPITSIEEYDLSKSRGFEPLLDLVLFRMDIDIRVQIQREMFGGSSLNKGDVATGNLRYYIWCWENKKHFDKCQNCFRPLPGYSAAYVSHIESRKKRPEFAYDVRNSNILCLKCHQTWENPSKFKYMAIYRENILIINLMNVEYKSGLT